MWNGDFGDWVWDTVINLVNDKKDEEEAKKQALRVIESMIERNNNEIYWLKKFKRMIEKDWDENKEEKGLR